ncbi:MAG TPA: aminotransferase class I/II-fold pyridoxal phosphate-dependent enzyme, partial [Candidatus Acidoferrales bacterium]|nr:aminotransferase class I/II-fold pyridoxal phosphate-dependent enzyme [Candidatus Acidoferrales bacterium]
SLTATDIALYPERAASEAIVAAHLGVPADQLLLTNGVDEAILLLFWAFLGPGDEALYPVPTFPMYPICARATGAATVEVPADRDFRYPAAALRAAVTPRTRLIAIASPNNPTGAIASRKELIALLEAAPDTAVLVDEAYYEYCGETMLAELPRFPNLFIARTFSKAYGLAALRIGSLMGRAEHMDAVRRLAPPFNVNNVALACLPEALADRDHVAASVTAVKRERARLEAAFSKYGIRTWPSHGNFLLADLGKWHAEFTAELAKEGIYVRDRGADPACSGCVRITIGTPAEMERFYAALPGALQRCGWHVTV